MARAFLNNFDRTIAAPITTTVQSTITLQPGDGARFTAIGLDVSTPVRLTLVNGATLEEVDATAVTGDDLTVTRGVNGTTAATFPTGAVIACYDSDDAFTEQATMDVDRRFGFWSPQTTTTVSSAGIGAPATLSTISHPGAVPTGVTEAERTERTRYTSAATINTATGIRDPRNTFFRGNAPGRGGFDVRFRVHSGNVANATAQYLKGLAQTAALAGEPSAVTDVCALIKDSTDTNWQFATRTGTGAVSKTNLGVAYAANQTFLLRFRCTPNGTGIRVTIVQVQNGGGRTVLFDQLVTASIPANTTLLARVCLVRTTTAAAAVIEHGYCPYLAAA
jgi:hypothetical protein